MLTKINDKLWIDLAKIDLIYGLDTCYEIRITDHDSPILLDGNEFQDLKIALEKYYS